MCAFIINVWEERKWRWLWGHRSFSFCLDSKSKSRQMTSERHIIFITFYPCFLMFTPTRLSHHISVSLRLSVSPSLCFIVVAFVSHEFNNIWYIHCETDCFSIHKFSSLHILFPPPCLVQPYLKSWSQDLGVPILSVDYSLAPEAPFPRALEECFYAYCWALRNHHLLGTHTSHSIVYSQVLISSVNPSLLY